jgi:hypothetical protein
LVGLLSRGKVDHPGIDNQAVSGLTCVFDVYFESFKRFFVG